jgi:hypothetical protein
MSFATINSETSREDNFFGCDELGRIFSLISALFVDDAILFFFALLEDCVKARFVLGEPISRKFG